MEWSKPKCTWKDCERIAEVLQLDMFGRTWAHLCAEHHMVLEEAIAAPNPRRLLACWVKASGGAEVLAQSMFHGYAAGLLEKLCNAKK